MLERDYFERRSNVMSFLIYLLLLEVFDKTDAKHIILGIIMWTGHVLFNAVRSNLYDQDIKFIVRALSRKENS